MMEGASYVGAISSVVNEQLLQRPDFVYFLIQTSGEPEAFVQFTDVCEYRAIPIDMIELKSLEYLACVANSDLHHCVKIAQCNISYL